MDGTLAIAAAGLGAALVAALIVIRRRSDEREALIARLDRLAAERSGASAGAGRHGTPTAASLGDLPPDLLPVGVIHLDANRRVDRATDRAHALVGAAPGRLIGRSVIETFQDARVEALVDGVAAGGIVTGEARLGTGEAHHVQLEIRREPDGGTWIVLEDVSELRRLRQIRTEFIDNLGHELRTPLSTVSLLAETLAREAETAEVPQRMRDRIAKIEVETGHLVQMVSELLDLSRIEGGSQLRMTDDVDLGRLAASSAERLRLFAERQGVTLKVVAEPGLPAVRGDEERLGQVVVNLVHNAVKFSTDGGEVEVRVRAEGSDVIVTVEDHGIGIAKADRSRIFERFYKVDRARVRGGGTGLGLSIARHVVERHGGRIWVESEEGHGSTFAFAIPIAASG